MSELLSVAQTAFWVLALAGWVAAYFAAAWSGAVEKEWNKTKTGPTGLPGCMLYILATIVMFFGIWMAISLFYTINAK